MSILKFKPSDKVVVKHGLKPEKDYGGVYCNSQMALMGGKILTIESVDNNCYNGAYRVFESGWVFNDEMLEPFGLQLDIKICCSREASNFDTEYKPTDIDSVISLYGGK